MSRGRPALPGSWQSSREATMNSDSRRSRACPRPHVRSCGRVSPWSTSFPEILLPVHRHEAAGEEGISCDIQGPEEHSFSLRKSPCGPPPSFSLTSQRQSFLGMRRTCRLVSLLKKGSPMQLEAQCGLAFIDFICSIIFILGKCLLLRQIK